MKKFSCSVVIILLTSNFILVGCQRQSSLVDPKTMKLQEEKQIEYLDNVSDYHLKRITAVDQIQPADRDYDLMTHELKSYDVTNGNLFVNIYIVSPDDVFTVKEVNIYDLNTKKLRKFDELGKDAKLNDFFIYNDTYIYSIYKGKEDNLYKYDVVEEKAGKKRVITTVHVDNYQEYGTSFKIIKDKLYMIISDFTRVENQMKLSQKFVSYQGKELSIECEWVSNYEGYLSKNAKGEYLPTKDFFAQSNGDIMFEVLSDKGNYLKYKIKDQWGELPIDENNYLIGFMDHYAMLYHKMGDEKFHDDYFIIDMNTKQKQPFHCDVAISGVTYINHHAMLFRDTKNRDWLMALKENGEFEKIEFNIAEKLGKKPQAKGNVYFQSYRSDGNHIVCMLEEYNDQGKMVGIQEYYELIYE